MTSKTRHVVFVATMLLALCVVFATPRAEALNFTNTPHFPNPGGNRSNLQLNTDGTIKSLGGYTEITSTAGTGREGIDERVFRFGMRLSF
ncbi:MAG TPA: hypothetical protein VFD58_05955 [Blastocatellia bacterium]|nr:hypothetical protein [Blastocatellia bacterium]